MSSLLTTLRRSLHPLHKTERGQILVMFAGSLTGLLAFGALAVDIGFFAHARRDAQNDADAMALAAVRDLPDQTSARAVALEWGDKNDVASSEVQSIVFGTACDGETVANTVTVRLDRVQRTFLAGVLGITSQTMSVCATARVGVAAAGNSLLPFGFHQVDPYPGANPDDVCYFYKTGGSTENPDLWYKTSSPNEAQCLVKIPSPSNSWGSGNAGAVRLDEGGPASNSYGDCNPDNSGADAFNENIVEGSECRYAVNDKITPKPGNMQGPTCDGFTDRLGSNSDTLAQVFGTPDANGIYGPVDVNNPRFGLMPIVTVSGNGSNADITIKGFITVYINGACSGGSCNGKGNNPACVTVTPVKSRFYTSGIDFAGGGLNDSTNAMRTIKLVN